MATTDFYVVQSYTTNEFRQPPALIVNPKSVHCSVKVVWASRSAGLAKTILQGTVQGRRRRGQQKKRWEGNISEWI